MALGLHRERYSSVREELREAFLGKDEQESPKQKKRRDRYSEEFDTTADR